MEMYGSYPDNDYRYFLEHKAAGTSKHKYLWKYRNKRGNWVYVYDGPKAKRRGVKERVESTSDVLVTLRNAQRRRFMDRKYMQDPDYRRDKERFGY